MAHGIDFSKIDQIAYQGFNTEEKRKYRDSLLDANFTIVEDKDNPFTAPQSAPVASPPPTPAKSQPPQRAASESKPEAFTDHTGGRSYNQRYRMAHDYHKAHNPPVVDRAYWKTHTPGEDDIPDSEAQYWTQAAADMDSVSEAGRNDPFLIGLLSAVYAELESEYNAIREEAHKCT